MRALLSLTICVVFSCAGHDLIGHRPQTSDLLIANVSVFTAVRGQPVLRNAFVLIRDGRIVSVSQQKPEGVPATVIDGAGQTLLPAFTDFHTHIRGGMVVPWKPMMLPTFEHNLQAALYSGITAFVDLSSDTTAEMKEYAASIERGELVGPRMYTAGKGFTIEGGHPRTLTKLVRGMVPCFVSPFIPELGFSVSGSWDQFEQHLSAGPDFTKVYVDSIPLTAPTISDAVLTELIRRSHARGVRVLAHVGSTANLTSALEAGADGAAHIVYKDQIPAELAGRLAKKKFFVVPTLVVWNNLVQLTKPNTTGHYLPLEWETMTAERRSAMRQPGPPKITSPEWLAFNEHVVRNADLIFKNVLTLHKAGVLLLAGSDSPNMGLGVGGSLHRELLLMVQAGLTPSEALLTATSNPAAVLGAESEFGTVQPGRSADLLLVRGDPTKNIAHTQAIEAVIYRGRLLRRVNPLPPKATSD